MKKIIIKSDLKDRQLSEILHPLSWALFENMDITSSIKEVREVTLPNGEGERTLSCIFIPKEHLKQLQRECNVEPLYFKLPKMNNLFIHVRDEAYEVKYKGKVILPDQIGNSYE